MVIQNAFEFLYVALVAYAFELVTVALGEPLPVKGMPWLVYSGTTTSMSPSIVKDGDGNLLLLNWHTMTIDLLDMGVTYHFFQ